MTCRSAIYPLDEEIAEAQMRSQSGFSFVFNDWLEILSRARTDVSHWIDDSKDGSPAHGIMGRIDVDATATRNCGSSNFDFEHVEFVTVDG